MPPDGGSLYLSFKKGDWKTNIKKKRYDKGAFLTPLSQIELIWRETALTGEMATTATRLTGLSHPFVLCYSSFALICLGEQLYNVILPLTNGINALKLPKNGQLVPTVCDTLQQPGPQLLTDGPDIGKAQWGPLTFSVKKRQKCPA